MLRLCIDSHKVVEILTRNEDFVVINQVVDVINHLYHLRLECWIRLKVCQGAHKLFARLLVQSKLSRLVSQCTKYFPILLHLSLSTENFQPDVMVFDL